jgi:hypothetical protein
VSVAASPGAALSPGRVIGVPDIVTIL